MLPNTYRKRRHGKIEELDVVDLDPYHCIPQDAIIGSPTTTEVIFVGPVGVGKTTSVETLSTVLPITTEAKAAAEGEFVSRWKTTTTVGIDYGIWKPDEKTEIGLFGTAGQDRFESTRVALKNPEAGVVLWLYGDEALLQEQLEQWLPAVNNALKRGRLCIALNFLEGDAGAVMAKTKSLLTELLAKADNGLGDGSNSTPIEGAVPGIFTGAPILPVVPVVTADPRRKDDVARVVELAIRSS